MYYDLIYTRCGEGINIVNGGSPIKSAGFKVYSCSDKVKETGFTDRQLLDVIVKTKVPFSEPDFMENAYIYMVPDLGARYLIESHPIPRDANAEGDYSHRGGNFINQVLFGDFDDIYPFETFGDCDLWNAKEKGEAYYYEQRPEPLPERQDIADTVGYISLDDLAAFISDKRKEVLKKAVAFVISQFSVPPEDRRFLVIKEDDSKMIELWIAAIEAAFSPRIAAGISFATRMDKFLRTNKYTVNLEGQYQAQMNLQSANQKLRYRAFIVGVDMRDRMDADTAKPLANAPFVVLDGKSCSISTDIVTSHPYYEHITKFDKEHFYFCRDFLQMVENAGPTDDVLHLFEAFSNMRVEGNHIPLKRLLPALDVLKSYKLRKSPCLEEIYGTVKQSISGYLQEDANSAFRVMEWLKSMSGVVGDHDIVPSLNNQVCSLYADSIYLQPQNKSSNVLHGTVMNSEFAHVAAGYLTGQQAIGAYSKALDKYGAEEWGLFSGYFVDCLKCIGGNIVEPLKYMLIRSISSLYNAGNGQQAIDVAKVYSQMDPDTAVRILMSEAQNSKDKSYSAFIVYLIMSISPEVISSERNMINFCEALRQSNLGDHVVAVATRKAQNLAQVQDMDRYIDWIIKELHVKNTEIAPVLNIIEKKLSVSDRSIIRTAAKIQQCKPEGAIYETSAHLCALSILDQPGSNTVSALNEMIRQGFPSIEDERYADALTERLYGKKLPDGAMSAIVMAASKSAFYTRKIVSKAFGLMGNRQIATVAELVGIASATGSKTLDDELVGAFSQMRQFDKGIASVRSLIQSKQILQYMDGIENAARTIYDSKKDQSLFKRLFSFGSSMSRDDGKTRKN